MGSAARRDFVAEFQFAVASIDDSLNQTDTTVTSIRAGSVVLAARVRVKDTETGRAVERAFSSPQDVFAPQNGFDAGLYGTPTIMVESSTAAPTASEVNERRPEANELIYIVCFVAAGLLFVGAILMYCRYRHHRKGPDTIELSRTNRVGSVDVVDVSKQHGSDAMLAGALRNNSMASVPGNMSQAHWKNINDAKDEEMQPLSPQVPCER